MDRVWDSGRWAGYGSAGAGADGKADALAGVGGVACDPQSSHLGLPGVREQSLPPVLGEIECWTGELPPERNAGGIVRGSTSGIRGGKVCGKKVGGGKDTGVAQEELNSFGNRVQKAIFKVVLGKLSSPDLLVGFSLGLFWGFFCLLGFSPERITQLLIHL